MRGFGGRAERLVSAAKDAAIVRREHGTATGMGADRDLGFSSKHAVAASAKLTVRAAADRL